MCRPSVDMFEHEHDHAHVLKKGNISIHYNVRKLLISTILRMHVPLTRLYPETHEHKYDPGVLMHRVLLKQSSMLFIAASKHSSTSVSEYVGVFTKLYLSQYCMYK